MNSTVETRQVTQRLSLGSIYQERHSPADTMYALTGRRLYVLGDIDGRFRPRTNPYDLHAFGHAHPKDRLAGKLQGVWAQPVRGLSGFAYAVETEGQRWELDSALTFTQSFASVTFTYQSGPLLAVRQDFVALDLPLLVSTLTLSNEGKAPLETRLAFSAQFDLEDAWFTQLARRRNNGQSVEIEDGYLIARAAAAPARWAAAAGGARPLCEARLLDNSAGELAYDFLLEPGAQETFTFAAAVESEHGAQGALETLETGLLHAVDLQAQREAQFQTLLAEAPYLETPDPRMNAAFTLACTNMVALEAEAPALGRFFYAGLEIFPFWFSNDGAYSIPGLMAAGLRESALNHVRIGQRKLEKGRVPHQVSPSGKVAFPGNAEETQLWVLSMWEAYRWTADRAFLSEMYPAALQGMFQYVLGSIDPDGDGYPDGPGMVEAAGMGAEMLDSAAYTWAALLALSEMAEVLGDAENARRARERADQIGARFDADWWDAPSGTYAMSLTGDNSRYAVPHWAVIVPLEVGLATPEHAARTLAALHHDGYLNRWGLKHTRGDDERVWTLPTALLSRAAYRYSEPGLGFAMLRNITETLEAGPIGLFHELIPEGACIIQLWSAASFIRGVIENLLGIQVSAAKHALELAPNLPGGWDSVTLEDLSFGEHRVTLKFQPKAITVYHISGELPLEVTLRADGVQTARIAPGGSERFRL